MLTLVLMVVLFALVFEYINGFHDTANSIATVVATKVLSPMQAVMLAAGTNLFGALVGTAVAKTIASGLIDTQVVQVTSQVLICALAGGIVWNLITWYLGLPSSSSHALIGGLCGAALAASGNTPDHHLGAGCGAFLERRGPAVEGDRANGDFAIDGLHRRLCGDGFVVCHHCGHGEKRRCTVSPGETALGQRLFRQGADRFGRLHGLRARHE